MKCFDCEHDTDGTSSQGHTWVYNPCQTKTIYGPCKCKTIVYGCSYPKCVRKAANQSESEYSKESHPHLCEAHDELKEFIEDCVRGALRKL
jgi:hypothetical protein